MFPGSSTTKGLFRLFSSSTHNFVTPIYRLPDGTLTEIFFIDFAGGQSPIRLMLVYRIRHRVAEGMEGIWKVYGNL